MSFTTKRISAKPKKQSLWKRSATRFSSVAQKAGGLLSFSKKSQQRMRPKFSKFSSFLGAVLIILGTWFAFQITVTVYRYVTYFEWKDLVFMWGAELKADTHDHTNILLVGVGGTAHESPDLTDSIIVASIDNYTHAISMISIPRDLYIPEKNTRINQVYQYARSKYKKQLHKEASKAKSLAMDDLTETVGNLFDIDIHYHIKVDFKAFKDVVDALGGITVLVENAINDPYYPDEHTVGYDPFKISKGLHTLDGETALKYVRSRKTTSDYDRSRRQRQVILAVKDAALATNTLTSPVKIKALYDAVSANLDTNFTVQEIIRLAEIGSEISSTDLVSYGIHDDPLRTGGFLYTPSREDYGGAFVLLPYNYEWVHTFARYLFVHRSLYQDPSHMIVLNGSQKSGIASKIYFYLQRFGLNVTDVDNTIERDLYNKNIILDGTDNEDTVNLIKDLLDENNNWSVEKCPTELDKELDTDVSNADPHCSKYPNSLIIIAGKDVSIRDYLVPYNTSIVPTEE